jgi:HEAT repeat protein
MTLEEARSDLKHPSPRRRERALGVLSEGRLGSDFDRVARGLADSDPNVRGTAAVCLASFPSEQTLNLLLGVLAQDSYYGARALGCLGDAGAVDALAAVLLDTALEQRIGASMALSLVLNTLEALGRIGDPKAVACVEEMLKDERGSVRREAASALAVLGSVPSVHKLIAALDDSDVHVVLQAASSLGDLGDPRAVPALCKLVDDANSDLASAAAEALGRIGNTDAVETLLAVMQTDGWARYHAAIALGQIGDGRAYSSLVAALRDTDAGIRCAAIEGLGRLGDRRCIGLLEDLRATDDGRFLMGSVRHFAGEALARLG